MRVSHKCGINQNTEAPTSPIKHLPCRAFNLDNSLMQTYKNLIINLNWEQKFLINWNIDRCLWGSIWSIYDFPRGETITANFQSIIRQYKSKGKNPFYGFWIVSVCKCTRSLCDKIYQSSLAPTSVTFGRLENCIVTSSHSPVSSSKKTFSEKSLHNKC